MSSFITSLREIHSLQQRDVYYRAAKELGYRARSAFKLLQVDAICDIFTGVRNAVDLCAAPGSWSQVLSRKLNENASTPARIISVDLQEMTPIEGVHIIQGDITKKETSDIITEYFGGQAADLVVSDGAPDVTGVHEIDEYVQSQLLLAALAITTHVLRRGGTFVAKIFRGEGYTLLHSQLRIFFDSVQCIKPQSSRYRSAEHFIVCKLYNPPHSYIPTFVSALAPDTDTSIHTNTNTNTNPNIHTPSNTLIRQFLLCGDLSTYHHTINNTTDTTNSETTTQTPASDTSIQNQSHSTSTSTETSTFTFTSISPSIHHPSSSSSYRRFLSRSSHPSPSTAFT